MRVRAKVRGRVRVRARVRVRVRVRVKGRDGHPVKEHGQQRQATCSVMLRVRVRTGVEAGGKGYG